MQYVQFRQRTKSSRLNVCCLFAEVFARSAAGARETKERIFGFNMLLLLMMMLMHLSHVSERNMFALVLLKLGVRVG
jgi:hypothetical protein